MDVLQKPGTYAGIGVREFWQYDPTGGLLNPRLQGWRLSGLKYIELPHAPVAERYLRTPLESEQAIRELERQVEATKACTNAAVRRKQELRALVADLPARSQPPDCSED